MSKINFEWPTPQMIADWPNDVTLKSIDVKVYQQDGSYISSITCTLSNGEVSPVFAKKGITHFTPKTIEFDEDRPVRAVQAWGGANFTRRMTFLDGESEEIDHYDPAGCFEREGFSFELEANEELIGVYG